MILGIGTDIVDINRMKKAIERDAFIKKVFVDSEKERAIKNAETAAGIFAAKEAFVKALGTGFWPVKPTDIEIAKTAEGKPYFVLYGEAKKCLEENNAVVYLSISHERDYATAFVVIEGR